MSMERLFLLACDKPGCESRLREGLPTRDEARKEATRLGWDPGPRYTETRSGRLTHHTDFCPYHADPERI